MTPHQPDPNPELDRILKALATTEPTPGLEDRILAHLAQQAQVSLTPAANQRQPNSRSRNLVVIPAGNLRLLLKTRLIPLTAGLAFAAALAAVAFTHHHPAPTIPPQPIVAVAPPTSPAPHLTPAPIPARRLAVTSTKTPVPPAPTPTEVSTATLPSQLAPELPLTEQEHTLARIAHGPTRDDFALLNPDTRDKLARQSAADFDRLFPKPTDQETYLATHLPN